MLSVCSNSMDVFLNSRGMMVLGSCSAGVNGNKPMSCLENPSYSYVEVGAEMLMFPPWCIAENSICSLVSFHFAECWGHWI